jgi:hypothetical protein
MARGLRLVEPTVRDLQFGASGGGTALIQMSKVDSKAARYVSARALEHSKDWPERAHGRQSERQAGASQDADSTAAGAAP